MDPIADRLLILSGVFVCWNFELLPRWALAVLVAARAGDPRARPLRPQARASTSASTGPGRLAVWPVMSAVFAALVELETLAEISLYIGLALALVLVRDVRAGRVASRAQLSS